MNVLFLKSEDIENCKYWREGSKNLLFTPFGICDTVALCGKLKAAENTDFGPKFSLDDGAEITITAGTFNKQLRRQCENILGKFKTQKDEIYLLIYGNPYSKDGILYINANNDNSVIPVDVETYEKFHRMRKQAKEALSNEIKKSSPVREGNKIEREIKKEQREVKKHTGSKQYHESKETFKLSRISLDEDIGEFPDTFRQEQDGEEILIDGYPEDVLARGVDSRQEDRKIIEIVRENDKGKGVIIGELCKNSPQIEDKIYDLIERGLLYEPIAGRVRVVI